MAEAYSLGKFTPSRLQSEIIEVEIKKHPGLLECCKRERVSVRTPDGIEPHYDNLQWHQDGGGPLGNTKHMVVWATEMPTELRSSEGELFNFEPYDMIWFDNYLCFHKQPANTRPRERWFVSIRCTGEIH